MKKFLLLAFILAIILGNILGCATEDTNKVVEGRIGVTMIVYGEPTIFKGAPENHNNYPNKPNELEITNKDKVGIVTGEFVAKPAGGDDWYYAAEIAKTKGGFDPPGKPKKEEITNNYIFLADGNECPFKRFTNDDGLVIYLTEPEPVKTTAEEESK